MKKIILVLLSISIFSSISISTINAQTNSSKIKILNETNFNNGIKKGFVLVDFYADWCRPCKMMQPILEEFAKEYDNKIIVAKIDTDKNKNLSQKFKITGIPCMILFKDGKEVKRLLGYHNKVELATELLEYLK
jgi:thioredoxin 1